MAEEYILYILTGAIFGAVIAVIYQMKIMMKMEKKLIALENKILNTLEKGKKKSK